MFLITTILYFENRQEGMSWMYLSAVRSRLLAAPELLRNSLATRWLFQGGQTGSTSWGTCTPQAEGPFEHGFPEGI